MTVALVLACLLAPGWLVSPPVAFAAPGLVEKLDLEVSAKAARDHPRWRPPQRVLVAGAGPERLAWLQAAVPEIELIPVANAAEALAEVADADALIGYCSRALLETGDELRWIQLFSAGVEHCVSLARVQSGGILLTNMQKVSSAVIAEHVMALMFGLTRGLREFVAAQAEGEWIRQTETVDRLTTVRGKTMLVVGLGGIGTEVAKRAHALGMTVTATRGSSRDGPDFMRYVGLADEAIALAREADVVVNAAPLTPATRGMFDAAFFAAMPASALFINVGRGGSVVTDDLVAALRNGAIGGAGLDVHDPSPLPAAHPLWSMRNVLITPHIAGRSDIGSDDRWLVIRENLRRYARGDQLLSVVDPERRY